MLWAYLHILCSHKVISAKPDFLCNLCKKTKFFAKVNLFLKHVFVFFHMAHKISVFNETRIMWRYTSTYYFSGFSNNNKF
jgi:hypothetical protein